MEEKEKKSFKNIGGETMKKQFLIIAIAMLVILALAALSAPASAWPGALPLDRTIAGDPGNSSNIKENVTVANGTFTVQWYKDDGSPNGYFDFDVPDKNLNWIGIYHSVWTSKDCIDQSFTYNSHDLGTLQFGDPDSSTCDQNDNTRSTGLGTNGVWFEDETANTTKGATNTFRSWGGSSTFHGTAMPMVFNDSSDQNTLHYWFNQGYDDADNHTKVGDNYTMNYSIRNVTRSLSTEWTLLVAVTCADDGIIKINGHTLPNGFPDTTKYYHVATNDVHSYLNTTTNGTNYVELSTTDQYFHPFWIWLCTGKQWAEKDLVVTDIDIGTPRPNKNFTVNATIKNGGSDNIGNQFNVSLYINGSGSPSNKTSISGLNGGASTTVSFEDVNLSKGCHSFRVFADSDHNVSEALETNNNKTVNGQVGYVIEVNSDSDFEKLNASGDYALPASCFKNESGTYYIQNLTIENCAGNGITIKNTNAEFAINNCTIENCTGRGVTFHNLKNGTIENSTVQNCTEYGIELGLVPLGSDDPEFVNITNNTINGTKIGVYLVGFNCTIRNNTITNSTAGAGAGYGIYLLANDANITYNVIQNNTDYGVKLYNSYNNYVYENNFIENNVTYKGHQAWDNGNTNYWNATKGNYWSDWQNNSGFPDNYSIDSGSNKDYYPKGLYDFSTSAGVDRWAYWKKDITENPPSSGPDIPDETELTSDEYSEGKLNKSDDLRYQTTINSNSWTTHHFKFNITENPSRISRLTVLWEGHGSRNPSYVYIWNGTNWSDVGNGSSISSDNIISETFTANCSDYINATTRYLHLLATSQRTGAPATLKTDYVKVEVAEVLDTP